MSKQVLLDTSFIITCVKQKIDFLDDIPKMGFNIVVPDMVIAELQKKAKSDDNAKIALVLLKTHKIGFIDFKGKNTDNEIIKYAKENPDTIIATLDREIKTKTKNKKLVIRGKKKIEVI